MRQLQLLLSNVMGGCGARRTTLNVVLRGPRRATLCLHKRYRSGYGCQQPSRETPQRRRWVVCNMQRCWPVRRVLLGAAAWLSRLCCRLFTSTKKGCRACTPPACRRWGEARVQSETPLRHRAGPLRASQPMWPVLWCQTPVVWLPDRGGAPVPAPWALRETVNLQHPAGNN